MNFAVQVGLNRPFCNVRSCGRKVARSHHILWKIETSLFLYIEYWLLLSILCSTWLWLSSLVLCVFHAYSVQKAKDELNLFKAARNLGLGLFHTFPSLSIIDAGCWSFAQSERTASKTLAGAARVGRPNGIWCNELLAIPSKSFQFAVQWNFAQRALQGSRQGKTGLQNSGDSAILGGHYSYAHHRPREGL